MRWRIKQFIFCERQQTLISEQEIQQLEPMVVELLAYFCRHQDQIISRDQLIEQVWLGRVVTDNAVSKVITKLRKIFNDDVKKPQFIATFPKKGYKFIAPLSQINEDAVEDAQASLTPNKKLFITQPILLLFVIALIAIVIVWQQKETHQPITGVKALTREPGREWRPEVSPDGKYLAYIEMRERKMYQWIKSLADETAIEISHGEESNTWVDSVSWNSDGSSIVYLVTKPGSCQYFMRSFKDLSIGEPQIIHNCPTGSYGKIAYTHDDNRLVYTENNGRNTPFTLFEMNLETGVKRRLNQPELFLAGNFSFDLHPTENKLLISSPDKQQWEGFYSLDLDTDELTLLFKQDAYICCGIWDHSAKRVVLMGEHPSYQIVSYNLQGNDRQVVYTGSEQVRAPERHSNGSDYLFSLVQVNQNAYYYDFKSGSSNLVVHTSVGDRLATFAHQTNKIAYIGISSGNEELWLTDREGKQGKKLSSFNDNRHYIELLWSYDDNYLIALTLNEIHLIDIKTGQSTVLKIPQVEIRGISWKDDQTVSYSVKSGDDWQVYHYDIKTDQSMPAEENWEYISYTKSPDDSIWFDKDGAVFWGSEKQAVTDAEILDVVFLNDRNFNLKKTGAKWAWQKRQTGKYYLMMKSTQDQQAKKLLESDSFHFDLSEKGLLYHVLENLSADIYQTLSN